MREMLVRRDITALAEDEGDSIPLTLLVLLMVVFPDVGVVGNGTNTPNDGLRGWLEMLLVEFCLSELKDEGECRNLGIGGTSRSSGAVIVLPEREFFM